MVSITLPDGNKKQYDGPVTGGQIAKDIAPSLFKKALVVEVNGEYQDLTVDISKDSIVKVITMEDDYALELIRHDSAHCMACLLYTSPSPRDRTRSRMPSSA